MADSGSTAWGTASSWRPPTPCWTASTLRFLIPVALLVQGEASFTGRGRLMERPLKPYEDLFREKGVAWKLEDHILTVNSGRGYDALALDPGVYRLPGNVSSQFFTGLLFVLPLLNHHAPGEPGLPGDDPAGTGRRRRHHPVGR